MACNPPPQGGYDSAIRVGRLTEFMNDLIDTAEVYVRTLHDLVEDGIVARRARLSERIRQAGPTVGQTVGRLERDGLVWVAADRHVELTAQGEELAVAVTRKHRLAERLLRDVLRMPLLSVHNEACRWQHVMSDEAEKEILTLIDNPTTSPGATRSRVSTDSDIDPRRGLPRPASSKSGCRRHL